MVLFFEFVKSNEFITGLIIILIMGLSLIVVHLLRNSVYASLKKKSGLDAHKVLKLETPMMIIIIIIGIHVLFSSFLRDYPRIHNNVNNLAITLTIILLTYVLMVISSILLDRWSHNAKKIRKNDTHEGIVPLTKSIISILLGMIGLIFILQVWGVAVGALLTSLGIAGIVLGLGFRDTLANVFGGISLILDDTFRKGELIEFQDGELGFVIETSLRSTKIRNFDGEIIFVPNGVLSNMRIKNYAQPTKSVRVRVVVRVAYGSDLGKTEKVILDTISKNKNALKYPKPKVFVTKMDEYYIEMFGAFFIDDYHELFQARSEATKEVYEAFIKNKIKIPYPTRTIYMEKK